MPSERLYTCAYMYFLSSLSLSFSLSLILFPFHYLDDFTSLNDKNSIDMLSSVHSSHDTVSHDLIKTGLLTPFGTTSTDKGVGSNKRAGTGKGVESESRPSIEKEDTPTVSLAEFDWLGLKEPSSSVSRDKGKGPGKFKVAVKEKTTEKREMPNTSFDSSIQDRNENQSDRNKDREYNPHGNESEYDTPTSDESNKERRLGRKRKLRPLSDEFDSEEDTRSKRSKRKKGNGCGQDDGDVRLYKERLR